MQKSLDTRITSEIYAKTWILNKKRIMYSKDINKQYQQAGITLVALVVTIIVLLILAGVTINLALGSNGVMDKAQYASNTWANATKGETSMYGEIKDDVLDLSDSSRIEVKDSNGNLIKLSKISDYSGEEISYNGQTYQLYLVDITGKYSGGKPGVWIQHKDNVSGHRTDQHQQTAGINDLNSILWQINPDLKEKFGETISAKTSYQANIKAVAYLADPVNWNETYVANGDVEKGVYAIGGVSAEMYCDSCNQARKKTSTDVDFFEAKAFNVNGTYGYIFKPSSENAYNKIGDYGTPIDNKYALTINQNNGIYNNSNSWITSPGSGDRNQVAISGSGRLLSTGYYTWGPYMLRPLVFLPSNIQIDLVNM